MKAKELFDRFLEVFDALEREEVEYVLIGGFAVVLYEMPRLTQDLDIFIQSKQENINKLQKALFAVFNDNSFF